MIAFKYRFHGHGSLAYLYKNGQIARTKNLTFKYILNKKRQFPRVAIVVSKKVAKRAVDRNRIRRRIYEIIRLELDNFSASYDLVIIVHSIEVRDMDYQELKNKILASLTQSGVIKL